MDTLLTSFPFRAISPPSSWRPWPSSGHSGSSSDRMRRPQQHPRSQLSSKQNLIELVRAWVAATPRHCLPRVSQCGLQGSYSLDHCRHPATLIAHCASSSPALPMSLGLKQLPWQAPVSSPFFHPYLIFTPVPRHSAHAFPKLHSAAHNHPPLASDCVNWCGPPSMRFYAAAHPLRLSLIFCLTCLW